MEELTVRVKKVNQDCSELVNKIQERKDIAPYIVMTLFSIKDAINELAVEIILLKNEDEGYGKGGL